MRLSRTLGVAYSNVWRARVPASVRSRAAYWAGRLEHQEARGHLRVVLRGDVNPDLAHGVRENLALVPAIFLPRALRHAGLHHRVRPAATSPCSATCPAAARPRATSPSTRPRSGSSTRTTRTTTPSSSASMATLASSPSRASRSRCRHLSANDFFLCARDGPRSERWSRAPEAATKPGVQSQENGPPGPFKERSHQHAGLMPNGPGGPFAPSLLNSKGASGSATTCVTWTPGQVPSPVRPARRR